jgi:hypothetical protein
LDWLARIEGRLSPKVRLDDRPCASLAELKQARAAEDARMIELERAGALAGAMTAAAEPAKI